LQSAAVARAMER